MKHRFIYTLFTLTLVNLGISQTTLKGYITQYEHGDSVIDCKIYQSTMVFNKEGKEIRKEWLLPLSTKEDRNEADLAYHVLMEESDLMITGLFEQLDRPDYSTGYDPSNNLEYLIENGDTTLALKTLFTDNKKVDKRGCVSGCDFIQQYKYNGDLGYSMYTVYDSGDTLFSVFEIDDEGREIYSKINMNSIDQKDYEYIKVDFKDNIRMEIREHGNTSSSNKTVTTIFYSKSGLPIYETIEYYADQDKIRWVIEYE